MVGRSSVVFIGFFLLVLISAGVSWPAPETRPETKEDRRRDRLIRHLKRLNRPSDWRIARKLFSPDNGVQREALRNCPFSETEWPWFLSSDHIESYRFSADFIPVNMDRDPEDETLIIIQSDPGETNYATFCLVDDEKRGSTPLSSFSEISHVKPVTYQIADLTGDGSSELIVYVRDDRAGRLTDSVRIIKAKEGRDFKLVWFGRLNGVFEWPASEDDADIGRKVTRIEKLRVKMRLSFNGDNSPATIILRGERELIRKISSLSRSGRNIRQAVRKRKFEERWSWDKKRFRFMRTNGSK